MVFGKKVGAISLGCDKNRTDTEKMLAVVAERHEIVADADSAEIIVVNTCAFLESARKESLEEIIAAAGLKKTGVLEKIIVTGCLPQKFSAEVYKELTEADAFIGVSDYGRINEVIDKLYENGDRVLEVGNPVNEPLTGRVKTTGSYAYLKIADGCDNHCTFCAIPSIRGRYRSVPIDALKKEVKSLGVTEELILVAQDLTRYGADLEENCNLTGLIRELSQMPEVGNIRLLYCYPEGITDELIAEIRDNDKVIKYLDIPFQHASDRILKLMNRKGSGDGYLRLIRKLKSEIKGIALRSTFIAGFPSETQADFDTLVGFLDKAELLNAGFFAYSREEGTPAYKLPEQIDEKTKRARVKKLYSAQKKVAARLLNAYCGQVLSVIAEGFDQNSCIYYGRAYFNAPDVDGKVFFFSGDEVEVGKRYEIKILKNEDYDLYGERI